MAVSYDRIIKSAAIRINGISGATSAALETAYLVTPITTTQLDSADFPLTPLKDTCLLVEEKLAHAIANTGSHPWRSVLAGVTASIAHKGVIPVVDSNSKSIIGVFGSVYDASDGTVCTEKPLEVIRRRVENAGTFHLVSAYNYKIDGRRIYHTRTNVVIDVCIYDRTARQTAIDTLTNPILLPDVLEEAYVNGMVAMLVRDDAFMAQSQIYAGYFADTLQMMSQGLTSIVPKVIPSPSMNANAA